MKKTLFTLMLATSLSQAFASSFYKQLCQFNPNWKEYTDRAPKGDARVFPTDREYIQAHLEAVLHILRTNPTNQLSRQQHIARKVLMHELDVYRQAGLFPHNYYRNERIPVFIDEHNTYCAVGHLMRITGYDAMAIRIAAKDNYVWVKDINDPELSIWQEASGFTVAELKLIQGAYDSYMPGAFFHPEKYDIPQQPQLIVANFEEHRGKAKTAAEKIWCKGEGKNGVLHGTWIQNYAPGMPWIVGYYENGKRTGQWEEYYQGTQQLCRTENWRNDKLNGVRRRFDRQGNIIEEIVFKDGNAVVKTNFDLDAKLTYVRTPIDSALVYTQIFTAGGALIAKGHEKVHNPGGLLWFQNIELTALNSMAITARDASFSLGNDALSFQPQYESIGSNDLIRAISSHRSRGPSLYQTIPLVEYKKEGDWMYYRDYINPNALTVSNTAGSKFLAAQYHHFGKEFTQYIHLAGDFHSTNGFDSLHVSYGDNFVHQLIGYGDKNYEHFAFTFHNLNTVLSLHLYMRETKRYNKNGERIGVWNHYENGEIVRTEQYLKPWKESADVVKH